jgi:hypothetical protein
MSRIENLVDTTEVEVVGEYRLRLTFVTARSGTSASPPGVARRLRASRRSNRVCAREIAHRPSAAATDMAGAAHCGSVT